MHRSVPAAPAGKLRHIAALGTPAPGGLTEGKEGDPTCSPGWGGSLQAPCTASASPSRARALPEEQPKVISETLRSLFKAAAARRALAGLGRGQSE